jgi:hypothetical protein
VDNAGTLTKYKWGLDAPVTAPAIALSAGTLTLTYGRTYVYCFVSKYTDSLGIQRMSIGPPSPVSAHTGPIANQVVTLSALAISTDPQVNYKWIFEVSDSPLDTSATYYFAAEIANATTSWGDTLIDDALDSTRLAPFDNFPAPPAPMLTTWQNRIAAANGNLIQLSGFSEIVLGIPEEAWPTSLFFEVPSGKRTISAITSMQQGTVLVASTQDFWYLYTGYDASTFTEQDRVASPGAAGPLALTLTPEGLAYLAANQSLRLWQGAGLPAELSDQVSNHLQGTYAQEDIDPARIAESLCCWYDYGPMNLLVVFVRTGDSNSNSNVLINGDFSQGATGWTFQPPWALGVGGTPYGNSDLGLFTGTGPATAACINNTHIQCVPGDKVTATCWSLGEPGAIGNAFLRVSFFDAAGTLIGGTHDSSSTPNNYVWIQNPVIATAPIGTAFATADFVVFGGGAGPRWAVWDMTATVYQAGFNLMQLWSFATETRDTSGQYGAGSGVYTQLVGTFQTDKILSVPMTAAGPVEVGFAGQDYIYMGDADGNVYRWPDGFTDAGNPSQGAAQLAWGLPNDGKSRFYWTDVLTDRWDALWTFNVYAATADAPDQLQPPVQLEVQALPSPVNQSGMVIRASMNAPGVATGKYVTVFLGFPNDDAEAVVRKVTLASRPVNQGIA